MFIPVLARIVKRIGQVILFAALLPFVLKGSEFKGEPSWFPLGAAFRICNPDMILNGDSQKQNPSYDTLTAEVYHEGHRFEIQRKTLSVVREPRWFRNAAAPATIQDVQLSDQGASLILAINPNTNGFFRVTLRVDARNRDLWREIEHRWTDITPFLFAFFADGKPIRVESEGWSKFGGVNGMTRLAPRGGFYELDLTVDPSSIVALIPSTNFNELVVIAAFGEYQHAAPGLNHRGAEKPRISEDYSGPPIIVRSNEVRLRRSSVGWTVVHER